MDHPEAQALLDDATVFPDTVRDGADHLTGFLERSLPKSSRAAPRQHATRVLRGLLSGRERTTWEPIAIAAGVPRTPIQSFVGAGLGDDEAVRGEVRLHVRETLAEPDGVVVIDPRGFPKTGTESCGVARQGCGRWGAVDICQVGVVWADAASAGSAPWDRRLDLRQDWADDAARRATCHVPPGVKFQEQGRSALDVLDRGLPGLAHGGIVGADDLGRAAEFRAAWRPRPARDVRDGPCNTTVRALERRRPRRRPAGRGRNREVPFPRADRWAARQPESRWERITVRGGENGPLEVDAPTVRVRAKQDGRIGPEERWVAIPPVGASRIDSALTDAGPEVPLAELVRVQRPRHRIEEVFEAGNGEAGLDHSEVRSGVGWHPQMTLALVALWFVCPERRRVGGKTPAVMASQTRRILTRLLRHPAPSPEEIAEEVTRVLRRHEESRIDHWHARTGTFPSRRSQTDSS